MTYAYSATTGQVQSVRSADGLVVNYSFDGALLKTAAMTGAVAGQVEFYYDHDFRLAYEGTPGSYIQFGYDGDNLLTSIADGAVNYVRDQSGLVTNHSAFGIAQAMNYNSFGELAQDTTTHSASTLLSNTYTRDALEESRTEMKWCKVWVVRMTTCTMRLVD